MNRENLTLDRNDIKELQKALARAKVEKLSEVVPCKMPFSLVLWLKKHTKVSEFVRGAVIQKLERMKAGDE